MKFRKYKIVLTADIVKMYRQILFAEDDVYFQRIFWRRSKSEAIYIYPLNTVTYGTACAPFLALAIIQQFCEDEKNNFSQAAEIEKIHFYIDDFLGDAGSVEKGKTIITEIN